MPPLARSRPRVITHGQHATAVGAWNRRNVNGFLRCATIRAAWRSMAYLRRLRAGEQARGDRELRCWEVNGFGHAWVGSGRASHRTPDGGRDDRDRPPRGGELAPRSDRCVGAGVRPPASAHRPLASTGRAVVPANGPHPAASAAAPGRRGISPPEPGSPTPRRRRGAPPAARCRPHGRRPARRRAPATLRGCCCWCRRCRRCRP